MFSENASRIQKFIYETKDENLSAEDWKQAFNDLGIAIEDYLSTMHYLESYLIKEFGAEKTFELYEKAVTAVEDFRARQRGEVVPFEGEEELDFLFKDLED
ncbi:MAG: hypothetical protein K6E98_06945 [Lachnospiraceae bacterium]|nr:hypothetical protein [Lachnospiraceae bacterium]